MEQTPDTAVLADQIVSLSDTVAQHRLEFQAAESSLVTRIADVDDDRRLTTNRLQRAWQTHREEIDARLKHQASVFVGTLLLIAALLGGALFFTYGQLDAGRRTLLEEVARLRVDHEQLAAVAIQDAALQEGLAGLRASVAALSESLPPRAEATEPQAPSEESPPATAIRNETVPALPDTPEDLAGHDAEATPEPVSDTPPEPDPASDPVPTGSPSGDASPPGEDTPPQSIEPAARTLDTDPDRTQSVSARIVEEPLVVGNTPFALQLIGFYSLDELLDFARRQALPSRVYFREESYQGRPWFVLIHGLHARYTDASDAIDMLPTELAILDTWIRNFPPETRLGILDIGP